MSGTYNVTPPKYIAKAFQSVYYYGADDEAYEQFASRWGALDIATFRRVAFEGDNDERLIALFALSELDIPETTEALSLFLMSANRRDRSFCAVTLAQRQDERAWPILKEILAQGITVEEYIWATENHGDEKADEITWVLSSCDEAIRLFAHRKDPELLPLVHREYQRLWEAERTLGSSIYGQWFYDTLAYVLGEYGDFSFLQQLSLPPAHLKVAMVFQALGALRFEFPSDDTVFGTLRDKDLQERIITVLDQNTHLSEDEQKECVHRFYRLFQERSQYETRQDKLNESSQKEEAIHEEEEQEEQEKKNTMPSFIPPLVRLYKGHTKSLHCLAWSPDSTLLASSSADGTVQVWEATTGTLRVTFRRHLASVNVVRWSPDGQHLASGGNDNLIYVWDASTGDVKTVYQGHRSWIYKGLAWSPDGTRIASASWDHTVQMWEPFTGQTILTYHGHQGVVCSVDWSPDGKYLASGGGFPDCLIQIWNADTGELVRTYEKHAQDNEKERIMPRPLSASAEAWARGPSSVHSLSWSPDGRWIASAGLRLICRVWNAETGEDKIVRDTHAWEPICWSSDGAFLLTPNENPHQIDQWFFDTNQTHLAYVLKDAGEVKTLAWSPNGQLIAAATSFNEVQVWKAR